MNNRIRVRIDEAGRVNIPEDIMDALGYKPGTVLERTYDVHTGSVIFEPWNERLVGLRALDDAKLCIQKLSRCPLGQKEQILGILDEAQRLLLEYEE